MPPFDSVPPPSFSHTPRTHLATSTSALERQLDALLDPARMRPFALQRDDMQATELMPRETVAHLQGYRAGHVACEAAGRWPDGVAAINSMATSPGYVPDSLASQDQPGHRLDAQTRLALDAPFLRAVMQHPSTAALRSYRMRDYLRRGGYMLRGIQWAGNLLRARKVRTVTSTAAEVALLERCFGVVWPPGVDLYGILREMYPAFHARMVGQIPEVLAENLTRMADPTLVRGALRGPSAHMLDACGRYLGVYPVASVPTERVTEHVPFLAQDHLGRRAITRRVFVDCVEILERDPEQVVVVVDYAGGVGNLSELLLRQIFALPRCDLKQRLLERVRCVVADASEGQLAGGRRRFAEMAEQPGLRGIDRQVVFLRHDVTEPLDASVSRIFREPTDARVPARPVYLGMTTYTLGALDTATVADGRQPVQAVADHVFAQCWKLYAADFSSPAWRQNDFLHDTGAMGRDFLRIMHGIAEPRDARQRVAAPVRMGLQRGFGTRVDTVADQLRVLCPVGGLASHLMTVWPNRDGHNAGYSVQPDGTLRKPSIVAFAEHLDAAGARIAYKSAVFLLGSFDLGRHGSSHRAWALMPGWVGDFLVAENPALAPHRDRRRIATL